MFMLSDDEDIECSTTMIISYHIKNEVSDIFCSRMKVIISVGVCLYQHSGIEKIMEMRSILIQQI